MTEQMIASNISLSIGALNQNFAENNELYHSKSEVLNCKTCNRLLGTESTDIATD
jgi:hypothetical protein